ncbi:MAG: response regulator [Bryobacterales bacterium]|nr:response regulator [Bryobacterales bacterium]
MTSRVLLADDSPHAQRMGQRLLREEGFEVVTVTDGDTALLRLDDVDPDLVLADVFLPGKSGYEVCQYVKSHPRHRHAGVVLIAGLLEPVDDEEAQRVGSDAIVKKPFEASVFLEVIRPLVDASRYARGLFAPSAASPVIGGEPAAAPASPPIDPERVRAAVTLALDQSLPAMINEITEKVLIALGQ